MNADRLDSRVWLLWGICAMVPMLVSRHPLVVLEMLVIVAAVRFVWAGRLAHGWSWVARVAAAFVVFSVVFNALTVHTGNQVIGHFPESIPFIGGVVTWNAVVYGLVSGVAILVIVMTGTTIAGGLMWSELVRSLPARVAPLAVAGSVAWSFLPGASRAFTDIRESQVSRGHELRGVRDVPQLVVPLIEGGLERALTMSEALEARGFGASAAESGAGSRSRWPSVVLVAALVVAAYAVAVGRMGVAVIGGAFALIAAVMLSRGDGKVAARPRYRSLVWSNADRAVAICAVVALIGFLVRQATSSAVFNPYPDIEMPALDPVMVLVLALLLLPAAIAPVYEARL